MCTDTRFILLVSSLVIAFIMKCVHVKLTIEWDTDKYKSKSFLSESHLYANGVLIILQLHW